jgi:hypothetical protein
MARIGRRIPPEHLDEKAAVPISKVQYRDEDGPEIEN